MNDPVVIVPGGLNTDIIGAGVDRLLGAGELTLGGELKIGPGGKARNMAQMAATYLGRNKVAIMGRSSRDPFGFWKLPLDSLREAGVDTTFVRISEFNENGGTYPGIALIPVDRSGRNQIYVLPGVNLDFAPEDIDEADVLFDNKSGRKIMIMALEIPTRTVIYAMRKASDNGIRVILDPGGINEPVDDLLTENIYLMKPNEHETKILTGIPVRDFNSASKAAEILLSGGVRNVFITHGEKGGYLFSRKFQKSYPVPPLRIPGLVDETGCGDQVTAIMAGCLAEGKSLAEAAALSILAGTLQFHKSGIQPITKAELMHYGDSLRL